MRERKPKEQEASSSAGARLVAPVSLYRSWEPETELDADVPPDSQRAFLGARLGHSFSAVRLHTDAPRAIQRSVDPALTPVHVPDKAPPLDFRKEKAWKNPHVLATVYPFRDDMLRLFISIYKRLELLAKNEEDRDKALSEIAAEVQEKIKKQELLISALSESHIEPEIAARLNDHLKWLKSLLQAGKITVDGVKAYYAGKPAPKGKPKDIKDYDKQGTWGKLGDMSHAELEAETQGLLDQSKALPSWARAAVQDYSGMRYKSAHGSWYAPQKLLWALKEAERGAEFKSAKEVAEYQGLTHEEAYGRLQAMHEQGMFPDYVWKFVVAHTDLRVTVKSADWETKPEEQPAFYKDNYWRKIMLRWMTYDRTLEGHANWAGDQSWRAELFRTNRLVVMQAVCNEIAEALLRARGYEPTGGLQGLADWYSRPSKKTAAELATEAKGGTVKRPPSESYYRLLTSANLGDVRPGATLLWSGEWVKTDPEAAGNAVHPLSWGTYFTPEGKVITNGMFDAATGWTYHLVPPGKKATWPQGRVMRVRGTTSGAATPLASIEGLEQEFMRWSHSATVLTVTDNEVVTFEPTNPFVVSEGGRTGVAVHSLKGLPGGNTWIGWVPDLPSSPASPEKKLEEAGGSKSK